VGQVGQVGQVRQVGQVGRVGRLGGLGGLRRLGGKKIDLSLGVSLPQFLEKRGDLSLLFEA